MKETIVNLGKKGFWYYFQLILLSPVWLLRTPQDWADQVITNPELGKDIPIDTSIAEMERRFPITKKKSWKEFKNGLISHKHQYDYDNLMGKDANWYECKHTGCNMVTIFEENGELIF